MRDRIVGDPGLVESNGFAVEKVGQRFISGRRIAERTSGQVNPAGKVFIQLAIKTEAHPQAGAIAIKCSFLNEILATHPTSPLKRKRPTKPSSADMRFCSSCVLTALLVSVVLTSAKSLFSLVTFSFCSLAALSAELAFC